MTGKAKGNLRGRMVKWFMREDMPREFPICDFERLRYEIRPCDVLLMEGRSRVSDVVKAVTSSPWSHAALYIGRIYDVENAALRECIKQHFDGEEDAQLLVESVLGKGTIITRLNHYKDDHIRICRPKGISHADAQRVMAYAIEHLGVDYDVRQIIDLLRLLLPWRVMPRQWRSSLFELKPGLATKQICSTLLAEAFASIQFPVMPMFHKDKYSGIHLVPRNPRLFTPKDFDYSPYFEIIKYPIVELSGSTVYRQLPWAEQGMFSNDDGKIIRKPALDDDINNDQNTD